MTPLELFLLGALIAVIGCVLYGDIRQRLLFDRNIAKSIALAEKLSAVVQKLPDEKLPR